jgi:hypothetical protein
MFVFPFSAIQMVAAALDVPFWLLLPARACVRTCPCCDEVRTRRSTAADGLLLVAPKLGIVPLVSTRTKNTWLGRVMDGDVHFAADQARIADLAQKPMHSYLFVGHGPGGSGGADQLTPIQEERVIRLAPRNYESSEDALQDSVPRADSDSLSQRDRDIRNRRRERQAAGGPPPGDQESGEFGAGGSAGGAGADAQHDDDEDASSITSENNDETTRPVWTVVVIVVQTFPRESAEELRTTVLHQVDTIRHLRPSTQSGSDHVGSSSSSSSSSPSDAPSRNPPAEQTTGPSPVPI